MSQLFFPGHHFRRALAQIALLLACCIGGAAHSAVLTWDAGLTPGPQAGWSWPASGSWRLTGRASGTG